MQEMPGPHAMHKRALKSGRKTKTDADKIGRSNPECKWIAFEIQLGEHQGNSIPWPPRYFSVLSMPAVDPAQAGRRTDAAVAFTR